MKKLFQITTAYDVTRTVEAADLNEAIKLAFEPILRHVAPLRTLCALSPSTRPAAVSGTLANRYDSVRIHEVGTASPRDLVIQWSASVWDDDPDHGSGYRALIMVFGDVDFAQHSGVLEHFVSYTFDPRIVAAEDARLGLAPSAEA